jgi:hypothetical protein
MPSYSSILVLSRFPPGTRDRTAMIFVQAGKRVWILGNVGLFYPCVTLGVSFEFYTPD